jgi:hypothetical protein
MISLRIWYRAMKSTEVHLYVNDCKYLGDKYIYGVKCGIRVENKADITEDKALVTCSACLREIQKWEK